MKNRSFVKKLRLISFGASMADIAMLLLVFFMATTTTEPPKGVEVNLPKALTSGAEQDSFYITIDMSGSLYIDSNAVTISQLRDHLAMRQGEKDRAVAVTADKNLDYAKVNVVLNVLRDLDFLNVVFMSEPNQQGGTGI
jgi:biopolymer transport protein ExbD